MKKLTSPTRNRVEEELAFQLAKVAMWEAQGQFETMHHTRAAQLQTILTLDNELKNKSDKKTDKVEIKENGE